MSQSRRGKPTTRSDPPRWVRHAASGGKLRTLTDAGALAAARHALPGNPSQTTFAAAVTASLAERGLPGVTAGMIGHLEARRKATVTVVLAEAIEDAVHVERGALFPVEPG